MNFEEMIKQLQDFAAETEKDEDAEIAFKAIELLCELSKNAFLNRKRIDADSE